MIDEMKEEPLVSIIIPTYNYGKYIQRAIDSVLKQTYHDVEVIIVDDGSTDDTAEILQAYDDSIQYVLQKNQGASAARNRGLIEASGEFIAFLDADDLYHPQNIEKKVQFLQQHQAYQWCYSNWAWVDEKGTELMYGHEPEVSLAHLKASGDVLPLALQGYRLQTNLFMFKRVLVERLDGFDTQLQVLEDFDYFLRAAAVSPLGFVDEVLCYIYQHENSLGTGCGQYTAYLSRWYLHKKIGCMFPDQLKLPEVKQAWRTQQSDLYRNLSELMLLQGYLNRASVLLQASLKYKPWQLGAVKLKLKILWAKAVS